MRNSLTAATRWDAAAIRAQYRFLERTKPHGNTPEETLRPHRQQTVARMQTQSTILCVQRTTRVSYNTPPRTRGMQVAGRRQTTAKAKRVTLHATLALGEDGLPLGILRCSYRT